jgi:DNA-binding NtrC family response regulator
MGTEIMSEQILVIDDDRNILEVLKMRFESAGYSVLTAESGRQGLKELSNKVDLVILDVKMPGLGGQKVLKQIMEKRPDLPVIMLTAYGTIPDAVQAVRDGAVDYLTKPYNGKDLLDRVSRLLASRREQAEEAANGSSISSKLWGGHSPVMQQLFEMVDRVAPTDADVLLTGESGTGKELVARLVHEKSDRAEGPFAVVDCSATSSSLLESELFGHKKGSFTHAIQDKKGLIQAADKGTLFLDEIGTLSLEMQAKLLRFLQERTIRRIGDTKETSVDCRVVAATNAELSSMIQDGKFREDLYFRLKGFNIHLPPLRKRPEDIPLLAEKFLERFRKEANRPNLDFDDETLGVMVSYSWPGNVREMMQTIKAGVILCAEDVLKPKDLQLERRKVPRNTTQEDTFSLEDSERRTIIRALEQSDWVQKRAAKLLGISRRAINYKIKRLNIDLPQKGRRSG